MIHLHNIPTANTLSYKITLWDNTGMVAELKAGESIALSVSFDGIAVHNPPRQHNYAQQTPGNFAVAPGNVAYIEQQPGRRLNFVFATPNGQTTTVLFGPLAHARHALLRACRAEG